MDQIPLSWRQRKKNRQLAFHERYVRAFELAREMGDDKAECEALRKAQYWLDRYRGIRGGHRV